MKSLTAVLLKFQFYFHLVHFAFSKSQSYSARICVAANILGGSLNSSLSKCPKQKHLRPHRYVQNSAPWKKAAESFNESMIGKFLSIDVDVFVRIFKLLFIHVALFRIFPEGVTASV